MKNKINNYCKLWCIIYITTTWWIVLYNWSYNATKSLPTAEFGPLHHLFRWLPNHRYHTHPPFVSLNSQSPLSYPSRYAHALLYHCVSNCHNQLPGQPQRNIAQPPSPVPPSENERNLFEIVTHYCFTTKWERNKRLDQTFQIDTFFSNDPELGIDDNNYNIFSFLTNL